MNFVFDPNHSVQSWPITLKTPADGGTVDEATITVDFRVPTLADYSDAIAFETTTKAGLDATAAKVNKLVEDHLEDWSGIVDAAGKPVPFTLENLGILLHFGWFRTPILEAFGDAINGRPVKNSGVPSADS